MKKRSEVEEKYKWDLSDYFQDFNAWETTFEEYSKDLNKIKSFQGKLNNKNSILDCLTLLEKSNITLEALYVYANSMHDLNVADAKMQEKLNKIEIKYTEQSVVTSFISPELTKLSNEFLKSLAADKDFSHYSKMLLDIIREKDHVLSEENERILSNTGLFATSFDSNFSNFENGDLKFGKVKNSKGKLLNMDQSLASLYLRSKDAILRENTQKELNGAFGRYNNFLTSNYIGSVKKDVFYAKTRKFENSLDKALFYEEVSPEVYSKLLMKVEEFLPLEYRYFGLKKKLLKLKTFKTSDVYYNPLKNTKKYEYKEGFDIVCDALSLLGEDYIKELNQMFDERKIDVFPTENKRSGAYETVAYGKSPIVLTNFSGNFDDVSTLAHELGHAMHSFYSNKSQTSFKAGYTIFLAEIASTVNETILNQYMLERATTKEEKLFFVNEFITRFHATVFRQTMFAEFESFSHDLIEKNLPVSTEILNNKYFDLVKKYFGKRVNIIKELKYEWSRIPHFYTAFYVYKYATGLISAINIVENLKSGEITVDDYKKFLSSGCIQDPISLLKIVKVDLTTEEPFDKAFGVLKTYLYELNKLI